MKIEFYLRRASHLYKEIAKLAKPRDMNENPNMLHGSRISCEVMLLLAEAVVKKYALQLPPHWDTLQRSMLTLGAKDCDIQCAKNLLHVEVAERYVSELLLMWRQSVRNVAGDLDSEIAFSELKWNDWLHEVASTPERSEHLCSFKKMLPLVGETILIADSIPVDMYSAHAILSQSLFLPELSDAVLTYGSRDPLVRVLSIVCEKFEALVPTNGAISQSINEWIVVICTYFSRLQVADNNLFGTIKK